MEDSDNKYENCVKSPYPQIVTEIAHLLKKEEKLENTFIIVSPGEITLSPHKDIFLSIASISKTMFNTNAHIFDEKLADTIKKYNGAVGLSVDSGTRETYRLVKGCDMFDKVIENLYKYLQYGSIRLKYVILPGINDGDKDIKGIIALLRKLSLNTLTLATDFEMVYRAGIYSVSKFIENLIEEGIKLNYPRRLSSFLHTINLYPLNEKMIQTYKKRNCHYYDVYQKNFQGDFQSYRNYIFAYEINVLLKHFGKSVHYYLVKDDSSALRCYENEIVSSAFVQLGIEIHSIKLTEIENFSDGYSPECIFIIYDRDNFNVIKEHMIKKNINSGSILNLKGYLYSFIPTEIWLEQNLFN